MERPPISGGSLAAGDAEVHGVQVLDLSRPLPRDDHVELPLGEHAAQPVLRRHCERAAPDLRGPLAEPVGARPHAVRRLRAIGVHAAQLRVVHEEVPREVLGEQLEPLLALPQRELRAAAVGDVVHGDGDVRGSVHDHRFGADAQPDLVRPTVPQHVHRELHAAHADRRLEHGCDRVAQRAQRALG